MAALPASSEWTADPMQGRAKKRVILTGTYSAQNKGDAAMELSTAAAIQHHFDGALDVVIAAPFAESDRSFYAPLEVIDCDRRRLASATLGLTQTLASRRSLAPEPANAAPTKAADLIVDLSGDMLTEDYGPHVAYSHFIPLLRAKALGTPYFICAQSIGPFKATRPLARYILNNAAAITVRDEISFNYLHEIGVHPRLIKQTADMAFLLQRFDAETSKELDPGAHLDGPALGVSVSQLVAGRHDKKVGKPGAFVEMMAEALSLTAQEFGCRILFTPHVTGPSKAKDDRLISRLVADALDPSVTAHVIEQDLRPEAIKGVIARCDVFIGARMHANIAALSSHVPTVALAYSHKTPGIMRACGVEEFAINAGETSKDEIVERLRAVWFRREDLQGVLEKSVAAQRKEALTNVRILGELLEKSAS